VATKKVSKPEKPTRIYHNLRLATILILVPIIVGVLVLQYVLGGPFIQHLASRGSDRLITANWETAYDQLSAAQPDYETKFAYYRLKAGQDLDWVARHFSVNISKLRELNPGLAVYKTTVAIPPVEKPLEPFQETSGNSKNLIIKETEDMLYVSNDFRKPLVNTTIPELTQLLAKQGAITQLGDKHFRINKPITIEDNIRLDITKKTVSKLELSSSSDFAITCLCFENAEVLIKDTTITSIDPATNKPDIDSNNGRSFVRGLESSRMDIINSDISYLGNGLLEGRQQKAILRDGGTYGTSLRISDDRLGQDIATGWVEASTFSRNHFGGFTFGASGMTWRNNLFTKNDVYGLDPHDDSNNATIENNRFIANGKHGFIVSKRCNYNVIRNNISAGNGGHGYMLHEDSNYNVIENNVAIGNTDNFAIYASSFNTVRGNKSYNPRSAHVRVNADTTQSFVQNNLFYGGEKGVYLYEQADSVLIEGNIFAGISGDILVTRQASRVLFTGNQIDALHYRISDGDRVVFGPNQVQDKPAVDLRPLNEYYY